MSALPAQQKATGFQWTKARMEAAALLAENAESDERIAGRVGVDRTTLFRWRKHPAFAQRVAEYVAELETATLRYGVAKRRRRVAAADDRWQRMQRVIEERAADEASGTYLIETDAEGKTERHLAPGWKTGLLVRTEKQIGTGDRAVRVTEYAVDTPLLKEIRALEEHVAKELGQWSARLEHTGKDGAPLKIEVEHRGGLTDEERVERLAALYERVRARVARPADGGPALAVGSLAGAADGGVPE